MSIIKFDFENQRSTFTPPSSRRGALAALSDTKSGFEITIRQSRSSFDVVSNIREQRKNRTFGRRSLDPFARQNNPTPFTVTFSKGVYSVSVSMGDYGDDNDNLSLQAFSGINGRGQLLSSVVDILPSNGTNFTSKVLTVRSYTPIRSIKMIGGSTGFRNSVFYDNLIVNTNPASGNVNDNTPATAQNIGLLTGTFTRNDAVGRSDAVDYYKFRLDEISALDFRVTANSTGLPPSSALFYDANGNGVLDESEERVLSYIPVGNQEALFPGTYFVKISDSNTERRYNLTLSATPKPSNLAFDPGYEPASAFDITPFLSSGSFTARDAVGVYDEADYYKFTITQPRNFTSTKVNIPYTIGVGIGLQDDINGTYSPGDRYFTADLGSNYPPRRLQPGTYYISVNTATNAQTRYELTFNLS